MDDDNLVLIFFVLLLVLLMIMMYVSMTQYKNLYTTGLQGPPGIPGPQGPSGELPIIQLPLEIADGADFLFNYKESVILITGQTEESFGLPYNNPAIVKIQVVYSYQVVALKTYIYNVFDYQGNGKQYYRLRVVSTADENATINDTNWQLVQTTGSIYSANKI
jgi:hypothetical protein